MATTYNPYEGATALAQAIAQFQKQQRVNPVADALHSMSMRYRNAATDAERAALNAAANATRMNFLRSGGSPYELPTDLWGADPTQGFQTGLEQFTPGYAGDHTTIGQKMKLAAMTGMFGGQPTYERQLQEAQLTGMYGGQPTLYKQVTEAGLTGMYQGQPTWERDFKERQFALEAALKSAQLANMGRSGSGGGGGGGGGGSSSDGKTLTERQNAALANAMEFVNDALIKGTSPEELKVNIDSWASKLVRDGVDIEKLKEYVDQAALAMEEYQFLLKNEEEERERQRLKARPVWQKVIDILPGKQFR